MITMNIDGTDIDEEVVDSRSAIRVSSYATTPPVSAQISATDRSQKLKDMLEMAPLVEARV